MNDRKGIYFALGTAIISGFSIFLNGFFVVKIVKDPFVLTTTRNLMVAIFLSAMVIGIAKRFSLNKLTLKQWGQLILVGIIGGSIPFLLFFKGLSVSSNAALNGAFIHKALFIPVALLAVVFLKEKLNFWQVGALGLILAGILLAGGPKNWQMGFGEGLVALAVVFWATETIIVKVYLKDINPLVLGWGRMFFGSMIMLGFLFFTGNVRTINSLSFSGFIWIIGTSVLLMGYVIGWFYALKNAPATVVTSILTLGFPLTVILNLIISGSFDPGKIIGSILIIGGGWLIIQLTSLRGQLELKHA